jgi:ankyrin repeat protein
MNDLTDAIMLLEDEKMLGLLESGAAVDVVDDGLTPLQWAASAGNAEAVKALLQFGADPNLPGERGDGTTALHFATGAAGDASTSSGVSVMVELLCRAGADPDCRNDIGMTPMMIAAKFGQIDAVKALLRYGAGLDTHDNHQNSALHWSAIGGDHAELNSYLIELGASPSVKNGYAMTFYELLEATKRGAASQR